MVKRLALLAAAAAATSVLGSTPCLASEWALAGAGNGHGETMTLQVDPQRSWIFECTPDAVAITETGVTELLDIRGSGRVGDTPGSVMPAGAAMMSLYTGTGQPRMQPADYKPNAVGGWDLTLRLAKNDRALTGLEKADALSLFTTGFTALRPVDAATRAQFKGFLARCKA